MRLMATWLLALVVFTTMRSASADELTTLDGEQIKGAVTAIDATGKISGDGVAAGTELDALQRIDRQVADGTKGSVALDLIGGGRIHGDAITIENEKFHVTWSVGEKLVLPIDVVQAVRFKPTAVDETFEAALAKPSPDNDRLFVEVDGKLAVLTGLIESLTADKITFQYEGAQQTLDTPKLFGIVVAQVGKATKENSGVTVMLADGSRVAGVVKSLENGQLNLTVGPTSLALPWNAVKSVVVRSSRLAYLSDLDPTEVDESRVVTLPQPWQRDKNVYKKSLMLGDRKYERGIGTHAYSKLTFDIAGAYDQFAADIGLDSVTERKGDCVFVVIGDGEELLRERMQGASAPKSVKLDVSGVKQLTLLVEPGEDLDLADAANWANARVIKQK